MNTTEEKKLFDPEWFPLYHRRFGASTNAWDAQTIGAYFLLLCHQWDNGSIPTDPKAQKLIARCSYTVLEKLAAKFSISSEGLLQNPKMEIIRKEQILKRDKLSKGAKKTNLKRWAKASPSDSLSDSLSVSQKEEEEKKELPFLVIKKGNSFSDTKTDIDTKTEPLKTQPETPFEKKDPSHRDAALWLADLATCQTITEVIGMQNHCNWDEAVALRDRYIACVRKTKMVIVSNQQLRYRCINWCRTNAPKILAEMRK